MKKILIFTGSLIVIYIIIFFMPLSAERFSLNPEYAGEIWRFATYSFTHLNLKHLAENIVGLSLLSFIAIELKTYFSDFSSTYLSSGIISALPIWLVMSFTALGASNAILGGFGLISMETKKYNIKGWIVIAVLTVLIFMKSIINFFSYGFSAPEFSFALKQGTAHFSGLLFGISFFCLLKKLMPVLERKKLSVLRRASL